MANMNPDRMAALERVADAAQKFTADWLDPTRGTAWLDSVDVLMRHAVPALDALPAPQPHVEAETVRVAVYRWPTGAIDAEALIGDDPPRDGPCVAILTADIPTQPPAVPVVVATVEGEP